MESQIRAYRPDDLAEVQRLHDESGLDYQLPDLRSPLFLITRVAERAGRIVAVAGCRIEVELYLWMAHDAGTPEERWEDLQRLNVDVMQALWMQGIDDCVCWVPKEIEKSFAKRLTALGFSPDRDGWRSWSRKTDAQTLSD